MDDGVINMTYQDMIKHQAKVLAEVDGLSRFRLMKHFESVVREKLLADTTGTGILLEAIQHELMNHEYGVTSDPTEALEALGLTAEDLQRDNVRTAMEKAMAKYNNF